MLRTFAPEAPARPALAPLRLAAIARRSFPPVSGDGPHGSIERYHADLSALYGVSFDLDRFRGANRNSFTDMAVEVCRSLDFAGPVDLVITGHSGPDVDAYRLPACTLAGIVPGDPLAVGVCDQGVSLPFTALRLAADYARTGAARHVLVVLLDQVTHAYGTVPPPELDPVADGAVALLFGPAGPGEGIEARFLHGVRPAVPDRTPTVLVAGSGVTGDLPSAGTVIRTPPGRPATGLWWPLAGDDRPETATTMLVDRDATSGHLCVATVVTTRERSW